MWEFIRNATIIWVGFYLLLALAALLYLHTNIGLLVLGGLVIVIIIIVRSLSPRSEGRFEGTKILPVELRTREIAASHEETEFLTPGLTNPQILPIGSKVLASQDLFDQDRNQLFTKGRAYTVTGYNIAYPEGVILLNDANMRWMVLARPGGWGTSFFIQPPESSEERND